MLLAAQRRLFWSGVAAGIGFLFNAKAVFVLTACAVFAWPAVLPALARILSSPALRRSAGCGDRRFARALIDQVWRWPAAIYAGSPIVPDPVWNGVLRSVNWAGFHAALLIGAVLLWSLRPQWRFAAWAIIAFAGVIPGWRFFPRYFLLLLPPLVMAAAYGLANARARWVPALALLAMTVPLVRFGPKYFTLASSPDLAMDRDSRAAARIALRYPGKTLYVWGYRPELYLYTNLRPATKWLDSQALTGVPADRHLTQSDVVYKAGTAEARAELARSKPDILIDGLSPFNPALSMDRYPELRAWLAGYREITRTWSTVIYARRTNGKLD